MHASPEGSHRHHSARPGLEDELAQIRQVTAQFHRVEGAAAGYELGYVNGSGGRSIIRLQHFSPPTSQDDDVTVPVLE